MKTKKTSNKKKESQKANPFPHCGNFQKMAEMMKNCCPEEGGAVDCCSMIRRMMERAGRAGDKKTEEEPKP